MKTQWLKIINLHKEFKKNDQFLNASKLWKKIKVSKATFYRLIITMQENLNAPIIRNRSLGYKYDPEQRECFELPGIWFSEHELQALLALRHISNSLQDGFFGEYMSPLNQHLNELLKIQDIDKKSWIEKIKLVSIAFRKTESNIFQTVMDAILHEKKLGIVYWKYHDEPNSLRTISPQIIFRYKDNWYIVAYCHKDNILKTFAINRIKKTETIDEAVKIIPRDELESYYKTTYGIFSGNTVKTAVIQFKNYAAFEVSQEEWHPKQIRKNISKECIHLEIPYGHSKELIMDILRWGDEAEVISPPELRIEIATMINNLHSVYSKKDRVSLIET